MITAGPGVLDRGAGGWGGTLRPVFYGLRFSVGPEWDFDPSPMGSACRTCVCAAWGRVDGGRRVQIVILCWCEA